MLFSTGGTRNRTPAPYGGAVEQVGSRQRVLVDAKDASQTFGTSDPVKANSGMTEGPDALIMCGGGAFPLSPEIRVSSGARMLSRISRRTPTSLKDVYCGGLVQLPRQSGSEGRLLKIDEPPSPLVYARTFGESPTVFSYGNDVTIPPFSPISLPISESA